MTDLTVANTILAQLGGNRFRTMTGCHSFTGSADGLMFKIPSKNKARICGARITLTPADDYTVEFFRFRRKAGILSVETVSKSEGVYCDMLESVFADATGYATSL